MDYRLLGGSGLRVPILSFGTATFGGKGQLFSALGDTELQGARGLVDICLDAGVTMFDSAATYSDGRAEEILGAAIRGRRDKVLLSTKAGLRSGDDPNDRGASRHYLIRACESALRRLQTDYIDVFYLHAYDPYTPVEETLNALDDLVRVGKIRYVGASNFSGWHLMKFLAIAGQHNLPRYVTHQVYYSLANRDYEWELMPLALDQNVAAAVWSPLASGLLTGRIRRGVTAPPGTRRANRPEDAPHVDTDRLYRIIDALDEISAETGKTLTQVAVNWLTQRPTVSTVILGARNEQQLRENLGSVGWRLTNDHVRRLDEASETSLPYPYWHQQSTIDER